MDKRQQETASRYAALLQKENIDLAVAVGRHSEHLGVGEQIWADIRSKMIFKKGATLLDIGCGYGEVTRYCMQASQAYDMSLHLIDIKEALTLIQREMHQDIPARTFFWEGIFPQVAATAGFPKQADLILVYSVLHYTDGPELFVDEVISLLAEGGQLLLGDLPNVHKKGRFLTSSAGRQFEAAYRGVQQAELAVYKDQFDYYDKCDNQNKKINDDLIEKIIKKYRGKGYDVYVLPQPKALPFSYTREDLLICRH